MNFLEFNEKNAKKFSKRVTIAGISLSIASFVFCVTTPY